MCTFDIVPSLGPQSQVLNPARASIFIHSLCSVNTVRDRHPLQVSPPQLLNSCSHGNSLAPATGAHRVVPNTQPPAPDPKVGERVRSPRCNLSPTPVYVESSSSTQGLYQIYIPIPQSHTHSSNSIHQQMINMGNKEYGNKWLCKLISTLNLGA